MICGNGISWSYKKKGRVVLKSVFFKLRRNRITIFMGKSGSGKTTLLRCIANLHSHYEGVITCDGRDMRDLSPLERVSTVGFVSQQLHLFPHLSVLENCTYALKAMGMKREEAEKKAIETLNLLGMKSFINAFPLQLSGGQQQRVAIARALVLSPQVLLMDEPTSALDPANKKSLESLLLDLHKEGITLVISSHDMPFIRKIMDIVYFMEKGRVIEEWDKKNEELSSKEKIKNFLSHM